MKAPSRKSAFSHPSRVSAKTQGALILGMHRSGTSAVTRVLNLLGCALPTDLIGAGDGNELGHWESVAAVTLNDTILASAGSSWEDWGPINPDWRESGLKADMLNRVTQVVQEHVALGPLFALKDPRLCRLADLWLEGMDAVGVEPLVILMLRNPAEVTTSLENRDLMAPGYGQLLWLRHALDAEYFSRGQKRVACRYDQLMRNWRGVIDRIKSGLGLALPRNSPAVHAEIERFLSGAQRHHELNVVAVLDDPSLSDWLRRTWAILLEWSEQGESEADHAELDAIRREFDHAYAAFARLLLTTGVAGDLGSGSRLKQNLDEQLAIAQRAAESAESTMKNAEEHQAVAAAREAELIAQLETHDVHTRQLQGDIEGLRAEAERLEPLAGEAARLQEREAELEQELTVARAALQVAGAESEQARDERLAAEQKLASSVADLHEQAVRNAELTGRAITAESALVQRQEELAQFWEQLLAAAKAASAAEAEAKLERERRLDGEQRIASAEARLVDLHARLEEARTAPAPVPDHVIAEITQLTRMLHEQEAAARAADTARSAAEQDLAQRNEENSQLLARLQQQEAVRQAAESARAATEQKLAARFDEIARLTSMLAEESVRAGAADGNADWLRSMMELAQRFPKWWALMPQHWRRRREHWRYRRAGLFDTDKYLETYPDVAEDGMDPVRHYILHGMAEGRRRSQ